MEIIALQEYTDKYISLYEGQIRNIPDNGIAAELIEKGIVAEHDETGSGGSGDTDTPIVTFVINRTYDSYEDAYSFTSSMTFDELYNAAYQDNKIIDCILKDGDMTQKATSVTFAKQAPQAPISKIMIRFEQYSESANDRIVFNITIITMNNQNNFSQSFRNLFVSQATD